MPFSKPRGLGIHDVRHVTPHEMLTQDQPSQETGSIALHLTPLATQSSPYDHALKTVEAHERFGALALRKCVLAGIQGGINVREAGSKHLACRG
jgi:hypothetical protein